MKKIVHEATKYFSYQQKFHKILYSNYDCGGIHVPDNFYAYTLHTQTMQAFPIPITHHSHLHFYHLYGTHLFQ